MTAEIGSPKLVPKMTREELVKSWEGWKIDGYTWGQVEEAIKTITPINKGEKFESRCTGEGYWTRIIFRIVLNDGTIHNYSCAQISAFAAYLLRIMLDVKEIRGYTPFFHDEMYCVSERGIG